MNASFWDVFWRPTTGKVHFVAKKSGEIRPKRELAQKSGFGRRKCNFRAKAENHKKLYLSCLKKVLEQSFFVIFESLGPKSAGFSEIH
jgi:hypothetical protein